VRTDEHAQKHAQEHPQEHPEDLLDLALGGRLMPAERTLLDRHLAICTACATHLKVSESSRSGSSLGSHDDRLDRWAVEHVMARLGPRPSPRWGHVSPRWGWLFAAVLLFLATAVSAKLWKAKQISSDGTRAERRAGAITPQRPPPTSSHIIALDPTPDDLIAKAANHQAEMAPEPPPLPRHVLHLTAAELFERARELGRAGKFDAAVAIHLRLQRLYPNSPEAGLSSALAGRLLLDRDRPADALAQFDRHLARGGSADEEALAGRAASLQKLGRHVQEAIAWRALLERHPGSVYADRARARLHDLPVH
jgi:anti-sigma factor RsiW